MPSVRLLLREDRWPTEAFRTALEDVGARYGVSETELFDLKVAGTEALTNALKGSEHGVGVEVAVAHRDGAIEIEVRNRGTFELATRALDDIEAEGGRGIPLMLALMDEVEIGSSREGTRVRLRKRLRRRLRLVSRVAPS